MQKTPKSHKELEQIFKSALHFQSVGDFSNAASNYELILESIPNHADSLHFLGLVKHLMGDHNQALKYLKKAQKNAPKDADIYYNLGIVHQALLQWHDAKQAYEKTLKLKTQYPLAHNNLALVHRQLGNQKLFETHCQKAYIQNPESVEILANYANYLSTQGRYKESIETYKKALKIDSDNESITINYCKTLYKTGYFDEAWNLLKKLSINTDTPISENCIIPFLYNYETHVSPKEIFRIHKTWGDAVFNSRICENNLSKTPYNDKNEKIRIGYVSPDFRTHSVAYFIESILEHHDKSVFSIYAYSDAKKPDETTKRLKSYVAHWRDSSDKSDNELYDIIKKDKINILIDLAGLSANNRLSVFCRKPAPVQFTYLGYPNTTGLPNIDYRLTDQWCDPSGKTEDWHTESLLRMKTGFLCYRPSEGSPNIQSLPYLTNGHITFGSFNNTSKINDQVITVWCKILRAVPESHLILKSHIFKDEFIKNHTLDRFASHGIQATRIQLLSIFENTYDHLSAYNKIDIALDTFPYNGTTTTCEALWMGVPVLTLTGKSHATRVGYSILAQLGLELMVAHTKEDYIQNAVSLALNHSKLNELRQGLRTRLSESGFTNGKRFVNELESIYKQIWQTHLSGIQR